MVKMKEAKLELAGVDTAGVEDKGSCGFCV
jgi:hypothetical protein